MPIDLSNLIGIISDFIDNTLERLSGWLFWITLFPTFWSKTATKKSDWILFFFKWIVIRESISLKEYSYPSLLIPS